MNSLLLILIILISGDLAFGKGGNNITLKKLYYSSQEAGKTAEHYTPPSKADREIFRLAFRELIKAVYLGETEKARATAFRFAPLHFEVVEIASGKERFFIIIEKAGYEKGGGFYALRENPKTSTPLVIMAPHCLFDIGTEELGLSAFQKSSAFILMTNTFHRYAGARAERKDKYGTDFTHREDNFYFTAFDAILDDLPRAAFIQLHGFNRRSLVRKELNCDLILSSGRTNNPAINLLASQLKEALSNFTTSVYGDSVDELGGTANVHAKAILERRSAAAFFHIEMSKELRDALIRDRLLRTSFIKIISSVK